MINTILIAAAVIIMIAVFISTFRFIVGPDLVDRVVSFDLIGVSSIALIALIAHFAGRLIYIDVALVYGLLSFLGVVIIGRYMEKGI